MIKIRCRSEYARKLRDQQKALDALMNERQRLDQLHQQHKKAQSMGVT